jgi:hypothetical protein
MPASGINLVDANVWLALAFSDHVHHAIARTWFEGHVRSTRLVSFDKGLSAFAGVDLLILG